MATKSRKRNRKRSAKGKAAKASKGSGSSKWAKFNTNSAERKLGTRKEGRCQLCLNKVPLDEQYTVVNNLEKGTVTMRQNAADEANEHLSHYCDECADKRKKRKEYWMESVREGSGPDQRGQSSGGRKRKGTKKAKGKAKGRKRAGAKKASKGKAAKGKPARKRARKRGKKAADAGGQGSDEPF